jgi:hypothetical protein
VRWPLLVPAALALSVTLLSLAAGMEIENPPPADAERSRPSVDDAPRSDFERSRPAGV